VATESIFTEGALVAERFRIVRFLGRGGVGEVYEAEDQELGGRVALKTLRRDIVPEPHALDRFRREVRLARRVTHPNVCRLFDVFRHLPTRPGSTGAEVTFVTMELLEGSSLSEQLNRKGRFQTREAMPLVEQIAAGLDAAHRAGVIHRDFKSGNVMLVPHETGGMRAVVTDFGFAHAAADEELTVTATASGGIWGTPAYLAPEQVAGGPVTAATDLYALGVVMYEMVTGKRPFDAETPLATAIKRLQHDPISPALLVPDLDPRWEQTILRCVAREPERRFATAAEVVAALRGETQSTLPSAVKPSAKILFATAGVLTLAIVTAITGFWMIRSSTDVGNTADAATATKVTPRRSVAVLGFRNLSGSPDVAWMSTAFSEILSAELAAGEQLRVLPGENVARMKADLALADADSYSADTLQRIRVIMGSDAVVLGSYLVVGDAGARSIRLDVRMQDATSGETIAVVTDAGSDAKLLDLVSRSGAQVRARLGVRTLSPSEAHSVRAAIPTTTEAARLYADGLTRLRRFETLAARELLEKAIAADPGHPLAHAELAAAWAALGYVANAQQAAKRAVDLSAPLARADRLWVEGRYRETTREWPKAIETYQTLFGFFPDNVDYGLQLASAQTSAGQGQAALATLDALRALPSPFRDNPRIDLAEAAASVSITDFKRAHVAALNARAKAAEQGTRLLAARARLEEGWALWNLGQPVDALAATADAKGLFDGGGDRTGTARASINMAIIYSRQGDFNRAKQLYEEALAIHRGIGNDGGVAFALNNLANLLADQKQYGEARRAYEQALAVYRKTGSKASEAGVLGNIANLLQYEGELAESRRMHEAALVLLRQVGAKMNIAIELTNLASLLVDQGDLRDARKLLDEALVIKREVGSRSSIAFSLTTLADVLLAQGDIAGARKAGEEALALRQQLGEKGRVSESRLQLAQVALEDGDAPTAEAEAKDLADTFRAAQNVESEANAYGVWALAALAQGSSERARAAIERVTALLPRVATRAVRLRLVVTRAQVDAASGRPSVALTSARSAILEAQRFDLGVIEFEARLVVARIELDTGGAGQARARLQALEREAADKGLGLIARRIRTLTVPS
jgi:serine/threonine protein kinase/tetratricopeptide (TPR) repeat protein